MKEDLKKYEQEIEEVQKKLNELDAAYAEQRGRLVKHGSRLEGIILYLREQLGKEEGEDVKEPEIVGSAEES